MAESQIYVGEWDEVSRLHASKLRGHRVEILVLDSNHGPTEARPITEGMFPGLLSVTEADFREAEWRGPTDGEL